MPIVTHHAPIQDLSWMKHIFTGAVRERFAYSGFRVVCIELDPATHSSYRFRMLFFAESEHKPVLSINLETSILGSSCITQHLANTHNNLGPAEDEMSFESFKELALNRADVVLH